MGKRLVQPGEDTAVTFGQGVWWRNAEGLTVLIDTMSVRHRTNTAWWLVRHAARTYYEKRWWELWLFPLTGNDYLDAQVPDDIEPYSDEEIKRKIRDEIAHNEHLGWLQSTVLYKAIVDGLEPLTIPETYSVISEVELEPEFTDPWLGVAVGSRWRNRRSGKISEVARRGYSGSVAIVSLRGPSGSLNQIAAARLLERYVEPLPGSNLASAVQ